MVDLEGVLMGAILAVSTISAIFSILIWRSNVVRDLVDQESEIRNALVGNEFIIVNPSWNPAWPEQIVISVLRVTCHNDKGRLTRIRDFFFGANGTTHIYFSVSDQDDSPIDSEVFEDAIEHVNDTFADSVPSFFISRRDPEKSQLTIESSKPEVVKSEFGGFQGEFKYEIRRSYEEFE